VKLGVPCVDCRPLPMWMENVTKAGETFPRFQRITDEITITALEKIRDEMYDMNTSTPHFIPNIQNLENKKQNGNRPE
jgi:hypothetical protein